MNVTEPNPFTTFDQDALLESVGGDLELLREIVRLFSQTDGPRLLALLNQGWEQRHGKTIYEAGHALKGLCGEMRAAQAQSLAREVEQAGESSDFAGLDSLILELISEMEALKTELRRFSVAPSV